MTNFTFLQVIRLLGLIFLFTGLTSGESFSQTPISCSPFPVSTCNTDHQLTVDVDVIGNCMGADIQGEIQNANMQSDCIDLNGRCFEFTFKRNATTSTVNAISFDFGSGAGCNGDVDASYVQMNGACFDLGTGGSMSATSILAYGAGEEEIVLTICKDASSFFSLCGFCTYELMPTCTTEPVCGTTLGKMTVTVPSGTFTGPLIYTLGTTTNSDGIFENLAVGDYQVIVEDINGKRGICSGYVDMSTNCGTTDCLGVMNGTAVAGMPCTPTTPLDCYDYTWNMNCECEGTLNTADSDGDGVYDCDDLEPDNPCIPFFDWDLTSTDADCGGSNGSISASAQKGQFELNESGDWKDLVNGQVDFSGLTAGTYKICARKTDFNQCVECRDITIGKAPIIIESTDIGNSTLCNGEQTKVTITASDPINSYTITGLFYDNASVSGDELTFDAKPFLNSEDYTVTVTNAAGCTDQTTFTLTNGPTVDADLSILNPACVGDEVCFKFTGTAGANATFNWATDDGVVVPNSNTGREICMVFPLREASVRWIGVTVSEGGCSDFAQIGVNVYKPPTALAGDDKEICFGEKTTLSGAALNNNAVNCWWEPQVFPGNHVPNCDSPEVMPDVTTDYVFWVCDNNNCKDSDTVRVNVEKVPAEIEALDEICSGTSTTLSAKDADDATYNYEWFIGATSVGTGTSLTTENLIAETTYTLVVTNPTSGCSSSVDHTISILELPTATIHGDDEICLNESTTLTVAASGGSGGYTYAWSTGATTESITVSPDATTEYSVEVTDSKGCKISTSITVTVNPLPVADAGDDQLICKGFDATLTGSGAGVGGTYLWTPGNSTDPIYVVSPVSTATYTVKVTDSNGCMDSDVVLVTVDKATANAGNDQTICEGDNATLTATGDPNDTNTFLWSPGGETDASITVNPTTTTAYTVEVTNENGCKKTDEVTVNVNPTPPVNITGETVICLGEKATLSATSGYVDYLWTNDKNNDQATTATIEVMPTETTVYTVAIIDDKGCTNTATHTVTVNPLPDVTIKADGNTVVDEYWVCRGSTVILEGLGGTGYQWTTNGTSSNVADPAVVTAGASDAFISVYVGEDAFIYFTLKVTDANGCMSTKDFYVKTWENPIVETMPQGIKLCPNSGTMIMANALGGAPEYTWMWTKNIAGGIIETPSENMTNVYPSETTIYTAKATDQNGCMGTSDILVEVKPEATAHIAGNNVCVGEDIILTASGGGNYTWEDGSTDNPRTVTPNAAGVLSFSVTVAGGPLGCILSTATASIDITVSDFPTPEITGDLEICYGETTTLTATGAGVGGTYLWNTGDATATITTAALTGNTNYSVVVTNAAGCAANTDVDVIVNPLPTPTVEATPAEICKGESTILSTVETYASYEWTAQGDATVLGTNPTLSVSPDANKTYVVKVTDSNGCSGSGTVSVLVNPLPTPEIITTPLDICLGGSVNLGAIGGDTYLWEDGSTDPNRIVTPTTAGDHDYTVIVTTDKGCSASATVTVKVAPKPTAAISGDLAFCEGGSTTLTATGGGTYEWITGETTASISVTSGGVYNVEVTNAQGCIDRAAVTVIANELPTVDITPVASVLICAGEDVSLTANASGGSGSYSYLWNGLFTTNPITVSPAQTAGYTIKVTDTNGCMASATRQVEVSPLPVANAGNDVIFCANATSPTLTATGGSTYEWRVAGNASVIGTDASITVAPTSTTTYEVTVFNDDGCSDTDEVIVKIGDAVTVSAGANQTICQGETASLTAIATGATSIEWSTGATGATIDVTPNVTTTYTVFAKNDQGCSVSTEVTVNVNNAPALDISEDATICEGDFVSIFATSDPGVSYLWSPGGETTASISGNPSQTTAYKVVVTKNGCSSEASQLTTVIPAASVTVLDPTICSGGTTTLTASDGDSYLWSPGGETTQSISATDGTYSVDVTTTLNGKTCRSTASATVEAYAALGLEIRVTDGSGIADDWVICNNDEVIFESVFTSGDFTEVYWTATSLADGAVAFLDNNGFVTNGTVTNTGASVDDITISLEGKDKNGCWQTVTKTLYANPALTLSAAADPAGGSVCYDDEVTLTATPSGGNAPFTYSWNAPNFDLSGETGSIVTYNPPNDNLMQTISIAATDGSGCIAQAIQNVEGVSEVVISLTPNLDCNGQSYVTINVTGGIPNIFGGYMISVNGGSSEFRQLADFPWNFPISNVNATFSVSVEDNRDCTDSESIDIVFNCTDPCDIVTKGGEIGAAQQICAGTTAATLVETVAPTMTEPATLEYIWLSSTTGCPTSTSQAISGATSMTYAPGTLTETTWFLRCTRAVGCDVWRAVNESNCIKIEVFQPDLCGVCDFDPTNDNTTCLDCEGTPNGPAVAGTSCDDNDPNTNNDVWDTNCNCAGTKIICADRVASNTQTCATSLNYGLWVNGAHYEISNGQFIEYLDGTAKYTAVVETLGALEVDFTGRTTSGTPKFNSCAGTLPTTGWYYYTNFSGTVGSQTLLPRDNANFQIGTGANIQQTDQFGGASWVTLDGAIADINIQLSGDPYGCVPPPTCDNVTDGGAISAPSEVCNGDEAFTITSTAPATGGTGAIEYIWLAKPGINCPNDLTYTLSGETGETLSVTSITEPMTYRRCSRRAGCTGDNNWKETECVTVLPKDCGGGKCDLWCKTNIYNTTFRQGTKRTVVVNIREANGHPSTGTIRFFVPKAPGFDYTFDQSRTTSPAQFGGTMTVQNPEWTMTENAAQTGYIFTCPGQIEPRGVSYIAIDVMGMSPGAVGFFTATILPGSGGEENSGNNVTIVAQSIQN